MTYQLFLENTGKDSPELISGCLADYGIHGFTLTPSTGYWRGQREDSWLLTIAGASPVTIKQVAAHLACWLNQDAVLVLSTFAEASLIDSQDRVTKI
jgi:hypothetical protein